MKSIYTKLQVKKANKIVQLAVLIDPDKFNPELIDIALKCNVNYFFIGGSEIIHGDFQATLSELKKQCKIPIIIFPGDFISQLSSKADAMLVLSVISGRNPDYLIGKHVESAKRIKKTKVELIPTGYILIEGNILSATQKITNTKPIPQANVDLIVSTAIAGEMLGMKAIYLEAGSGAQLSVSSSIIREVKKQINIPLIIGGGIDSVKKVLDLKKAGADIIVLGNVLEKNMELLYEISKVFD